MFVVFGVEGVDDLDLVEVDGGGECGCFGVIGDEFDVLDVLIVWDGDC